MIVIIRCSSSCKRPELYLVKRASRHWKTLRRVWNELSLLLIELRCILSLNCWYIGVIARVCSCQLMPLFSPNEFGRKMLPEAATAALLDLDIIIFICLN
jgi:hypothetical protein